MMMKNKKNKKLGLPRAKSRGFTLVEIMVAISIFAIVALAVVNAFLTADRINKKAQAMKVVIDNLQFALNVMAYNLKQGGDYHCIKSGDSVDVPNPSTAMSGFMSSASECDFASGAGVGIVTKSPKFQTGAPNIAYRWNRDDKSIEYWNSDTSGVDFASITIDNLVIEDMRFYTNNATAKMPRAFITIKGTANLGKDTAPFQLQTVISERF